MLHIFQETKGLFYRLASCWPEMAAIVFIVMKIVNFAILGIYSENTTEHGGMKNFKFSFLFTKFRDSSTTTKIPPLSVVISQIIGDTVIWDVNVIAVVQIIKPNRTKHPKSLRDWNLLSLVPKVVIILQLNSSLLEKFYCNSPCVIVKIR